MGSMKRAGYVKWARKTLDSEIYRSRPSDWFKVWFYIVCEANYENDGKHARGEFFTTNAKIAADTGVSIDQVKRVLVFARNSHQVRTERSTRGMRIIVVNYAKYQDVVDKSRTEVAPHAPKIRTPIQEEERIKKKETIHSAADAAPSVRRVREKADPDEPMSLEQFVASCEKSSRRDIHVIGGWADWSKPDCRTRGQWDAFIKRNVRAASLIAPFTDEQIQRAMVQVKEAQSDYLHKVALETVHKFLV